MISRRPARTPLALSLLLPLLTLGAGCSRDGANAKTLPTLSVAIAPYQDIAMLVTAPAMGYDTTNGVKLDLKTMAWEDILTAVGSAGGTVDIGFGSLAEYLTKQENLNRGNVDSVLFIYPLYVYRGGGFASFNPRVPVIDLTSVRDSAKVRQFLSFRIGAQRNSIYEMILDGLAARVGDTKAVSRVHDTPLNEGLLAAEHGSIDVTAAGLTQLAEASKHGGRAVLIMDDLGFADITGLICRKSICEQKRAQIEAMIRAWFKSVDYVLTDLDHNSTFSLKYLVDKSATKYTLDQYKSALSQEYFPRTVDEARASFLTRGGRYDAAQIGAQMAEYLIRNSRVPSRPTLPTFLNVVTAPGR